MLNNFVNAMLDACVADSDDAWSELVSTEYQKIPTIYARDPQTHRVVVGEYATPELQHLADARWIAEEKVDGESIRVELGPFGETLYFRGRKDRSQLSAKRSDFLATRFDLEKLRALFQMDRFAEIGDHPDTVLYCELFGLDVQKAGRFYSPSAYMVMLFDVRMGRRWASREDVLEIASELDICAPSLWTSASPPTVTLSEATRIAQVGFSSTFSAEEEKPMAEGLILRPVVDLFDAKGNRILAKIKTRDFERK